MANGRSILLRTAMLVGVAIAFHLVYGRSHSAGVGSAGAPLSGASPSALVIESAESSRRTLPAGRDDENAHARPIELAGGDATGNSAPAARLVGSVRWPDGRPAANLELELKLLPVVFPPLSTRTDVDGGFTVAVTAPTEVAWIEVRLEGQPDQTHRAALVLQPGDEHALSIVLRLSGALAGQVRSDSGRPVQDAEVFAWSLPSGDWASARVDEAQRTLTDGSGAFELVGVGPPFLLVARAPDMIPHTRLQGWVPEGVRLADLQLVVSSARRVSGVVLDGEGQPIPEAVIDAVGQFDNDRERITPAPDVFAEGAMPQRAKTGADGRFQLDGLCQRIYDVHVSRSGYRDWSGQHASADGDLVVHLERGSQLAVRVVSAADGAPLAGADVHLGSSQPSEGVGNESRMSTSADGVALFTGLDDDEQAFVASRADGHAVHVVHPVAVAEGAELRTIEVVLPTERRLAGVVLDADGQPVPHASVTIEGDRVVYSDAATTYPELTWERVFGPDAFDTDEQGRFLVPQLYEGIFHVEARHPRHGAPGVLDAAAGREDLILHLGRGTGVAVTLAGVARDALTGLPIRSRFSVLPLSSGAGGEFSGVAIDFADDEGRYRIAGKTPGTWLIIATAPGYARWQSEPQELHGGEYRFDIDFLPTRVVEFLVIDELRRPVELSLEFRDEQGRWLGVETGPDRHSALLQTGKDGTALARGLPAALIHVTATRGAKSPRVEYLIDLREPPLGQVELLYGAGETLPVIR